MKMNSTQPSQLSRQRPNHWVGRLCALVVLLVTGASVEAGVMLPAPDINVMPLSVVYNASATPINLGGGISVAQYEFFAMGAANTLEFPESTLQDLWAGNGTTMRAKFTMNAIIDSAGNLSSGSFSVVGSTAQSGPTISLLSGTLTDLQHAAFTSAGVLEFSGNVDTNPNPGQGFYDIFGSEVVLSFGSLGAGNSFAATFMVNGSSSADIGRPVPEPASAVVWIAGLSAIGLRRRRR